MSEPIDAEERRTEIALFRYALILPLLRGEHEPRGKDLLRQQIAAGQYDIWVGTFASDGTTVAATLTITEGEAVAALNWDLEPTHGAADFGVGVGQEPLTIAVDAVGGERAGHELHQPLRTRRAGVVVAAVPGFGHPDPGQQLPRHPIAGGGGQVEGLDGGGDGLGGAGQGLVPRCPPLRQPEPGRAAAGGGDVGSDARLRQPRPSMAHVRHRQRPRPARRVAGREHCVRPRQAGGAHRSRGIARPQHRRPLHRCPFRGGRSVTGGPADLQKP